jgi:hypothetical protein
MTNQRDPYATTPAETAAVLIGIAALFLIAWAISGHWPLWPTLLAVFVCPPLFGLGVYAALGRAGRGRRVRLRYTTSPRPAIVLTDTPRPGCPYCHGEGGWYEPYAGEDGEYAGETDVTCDCWTDYRRTLLRLPRALDAIRHRRASRHADHTDPWASSEPPF